MSRLPVSIGAALLAAVLVVGVSAGPAAADGARPAEPPGTSEPSRPAPSGSTATEPVAIEPVATEPAPDRPAVDAPPADQPPGEQPPSDQPPDDQPPGDQPPAAEPPATDPVTAEPVTAPRAGVDLRLVVTYDKPSYFAHEVVVARVKVTNAGDATATRVQVTSTGNIDSHFWHGFDWPGPTLAPGQSAEGYASGHVTDPKGDAVRLVVETTSAEPDAAPGDNAVTAAVPLTVLRGSYSGVIYGDRNGNSAVDPGELLVGQPVRAAGGRPVGSYTAVTDANGRFSLRGLPIGRYVVEFDNTQWSFPLVSVEVDEVDDPDVLIRAANHVNPLLAATAAFTRPAYRVDDTAVVAVTLTNRGDAHIPELSASCHSTNGVVISLGELGQEDGTTLPAGTTKTYDLTYRVTASAAEAGHLSVRCVLGAPPFVNGAVVASAVGRVPGGRAPRVVGQLLHILPRQASLCPRCPPTAPLPDVKVYLRDQVTGQVVARAVSNAQGIFEFHDMPADLYDFGIVGPWRSTAPTFTVYAGDSGSTTRVVYVEDGPDQPDPDGPPPGGAPAAPGGDDPPDEDPADEDPPNEDPVDVDPADVDPVDHGLADGDEPAELADTGAAVGWLALAGLVSLVAGIGLTARARRRV
ncbi:LPXTG cell wall anchor domain-containing protein [Saccharothrix australiensis]|uniref:LPXTG-motif cell wall-anchored protein n=1 Tax=Saccharothrix australiensis TaxID=2072 RepID=A0A495W3G9_9PSEU|nr:LPXTG cell wall anchor domain-containing protein [Saccharothrix australiensis]RKT55305.1 LPXTG-motif cell wall-anchored protein [Saccharothrix australiensis]